MPSLHDTESVVMRFAYVDRAMKPTSFPSKAYKNPERAPLREADTPRVFLDGLYAELAREDFVLIDVRTTDVRYASGIQHLETRLLFLHDGIPDSIEKAVRMRTAFYNLTGPLSWRNAMWFDEKTGKDRYQIFAHSPKGAHRAQPGMPGVHTGEAMLRGALL